MKETAVERRLAAILAADVVGYSRLMGADEVATLRALQAHRRELIDPTIAAISTCLIVLSVVLLSVAQIFGRRH